MSDLNLSHVLTDVAMARGLPNAHYTDDAMFEQEKRDVLFANWSAIGFAKDIPNPGDVAPIDFVGMPLMMLRDKHGAVHVYQNTCRHRGMILVDAKKNIGNGVIRCAYHSWCYSQHGKLVTTPHVGGPGQNTDPRIDRDTLGLIPIASAMWRDIVFVNISGDAPDFAEYAHDVITAWQEFEDQALYHAGPDSSFKFDVACNWKLAVENYCESYHLPWIHPGLNSYSRLEDHYHIEKPGRYSGQGTRVYSPQIAEDGSHFPTFDDLSDKWDKAAEYIALYPNVLLGVHNDHAFAIILEPKSKGRTVEHVEIYYAKPEATGDDFAAMRAANSKMWHGVFEEDLFVVEGMQKGRSGIYFDGGKFSPVMDSPTHCFHHWVASQIADERSAAQ